MECRKAEKILSHGIPNRITQKDSKLPHKNPYVNIIITATTHSKLNRRAFPIDKFYLYALDAWFEYDQAPLGNK